MKSRRERARAWQVGRLTWSLLGISTIIVALATLGARADREPGKVDAPAPPALPCYEARLGDGGAMKLTVRTSRIELETPYGKLDIPVADIRRLQVGIRLTDEQRRGIDAAIADLGNDDLDRREAAGAELGALGEKAHAALERACKHQDAEIALRAGE